MDVCVCVCAWMSTATMFACSTSANQLVLTLKQHKWSTFLSTKATKLRVNGHMTSQLFILYLMKLYCELHLIWSCRCEEKPENDQREKVDLYFRPKQINPEIFKFIKIETFIMFRKGKDEVLGETDVRFQKDLNNKLSHFSFNQSLLKVFLFKSEKIWVHKVNQVADKLSCRASLQLGQEEHQKTARIQHLSEWKRRKTQSSKQHPINPAQLRSLPAAFLLFSINLTEDARVSGGLRGFNLANKNVKKLETGNNKEPC